MHLLESYAVVSGAKIDQCFIHEDIIDLPENSFVTIHGYNPKGSGRQYKHWNTVIDNLKNNHKFTHDIIQIGGINDAKLNCDTSYLGKTTYNSLAYVMKHSTLHIGFDSFPAHLSSHYDTKSVIIFAHYANNTCPYFSSKQNLIILEPNFSMLGIKPTFAHEDPFDLINTILPEYISEACFKLLNI